MRKVHTCSLTSAESAAILTSVAAALRMNVAVFVGFAGAVALFGWLASWLSGTPLVGYDDANIFFVYARNLVNGHGFVYNAGGEHVEGFSSFLWLLVCSAARFATPRFEIPLFWINVALIGAAAAQLYGLIGDLLIRQAGIDRRRAVLIASALTAAVTFTPGFIVWNVVSLMDSGLWSTLLLLGAVSTLRAASDATSRRPGWLLPLLLATLVVTRPEALLWGPLFLGLSVLVTATTGPGWLSALKTHTLALVAFAATVASIVTWRISYFGYPFPNTYYAKAGDPLGPRLAAGSGYFVDFALANPAVPISIIAAVAGALVAWGRSRNTQAGEDSSRALLLCQACLLALLLAGCAIPVLEGGDHFGFWRMYQPIAPLVALQAGLTAWLIALMRPAEARARVTILCALAIALAIVPWRHWPALSALEYSSTAAPGGAWNTPKVEIAIAQDMRAIGEAFNRAFPESPPSVGVIVAGGFALDYRGETVDLMGLNNVTMAHAPGPRVGMRNHAAFNHDVFFSLAPDIVLLSLWSPERPDWFGFPMLSGEFDQPPHLMPNYFARRAASTAAFDGGVLKGLLSKSRIGEFYAWASVRPPSGGRWIHAVFSRALLKRLGERGYEVAMPGPPPSVH
jgi:arabinofuranosyltransferase